MGIVQHKSAVFDAGTRGGALTFDSPVTKGNLIVAVVGTIPDEGVDSVGDHQGNIYRKAIDTGVLGPSTVELGVYYALASADGTLEFVTSSGVGDEAFHLHIYEIEGYTTLDQVGQNFQTSATDATPFTSGNLLADDEFVLAAAANKSGAVTWTVPSGFGDDYLIKEESTNEVNTVASGGGTVSAKGDSVHALLRASATDDLTSVIVTFYTPVSDPPPPQLFLGSVVEDGDAPLAGEVFLGTVQIVDAGPDGNNGPYLGKVKIRNAGTGYAKDSAHSGAGYPWIGAVVVVESGPNGEDFPSLGLVDTQ